jgi:TonB family protein
MKKNRMFWGMLGLSAALHGLVMIGAAGKGFPTPPSVQEKTMISTLNIIKLGTPPPANAQDKPQKKTVVEKTIEPLPEIPPVQETASSEAVQEGDERQESNTDTGNNESSPEGGTAEGGTMADREYEALLAYIREYIDKNLVYPSMARRRNIEGIVGLSFEIETNGELVSVSVNSSSGSSILDNAAMSLIRKMHPLRNRSIKRKLAFGVNIEYKLTE